jgi:hypothetical protein
MLDCPDSFWTRLLLPGDAVKCSSQHTFDLWSVTHAGWGALFRTFVSDNLLLGLAAHTLFEWFESRPAVIERFRKMTNYYGDSAINVIGDTISFVVGYRNADKTAEIVALSLVVAAYLLSQTRQTRR